MTEDEVRAIIREELMIFAVGQKIAGGGHRAFRHYTLFYGELDARADELRALPERERFAAINEIGEEAHEQEYAEERARERADDPEGLDCIDRLERGITALQSRLGTGQP